MSLRERITGFVNKKTVDEMCRLAAVEIDGGGSLHVESGEGTGRRFLNITKENLDDSLPALLEILTNPHKNHEIVKFTILNREHRETVGFSGTIRLQE